MTNALTTTQDGGTVVPPSAAGRPPTWLTDPALEPLWRRAARALAANGRLPSGRVRAAAPDAATRRALTGLLVRDVTRPTMLVDLAELDTELRHRAGLSLINVVEHVVGPVADRPALRASRAAARHGPVEQAVSWWRSAHVTEEADGWVRTWATALASDGTILRRAVSGADLEAALSVVLAITRRRPGVAPFRVELAATVLGNAHALDDGQPMSMLVLRALAARSGAEPARAAADRRWLWESAGIQSDQVSSNCLVVAVVPVDGATRPRWQAAAAEGSPAHATGWDLRRSRTWSPLHQGRPVLVTENPTVLEAFATHRPGVPVVCVSGNPGLVVHDLLQRLAAGGADLRYHGDFDSAGVAITQRLVDQHGVLPWAMTAREYRAAVRPDMPPLTGVVPTASWDPDLAQAMHESGVAVHEEVVLTRLLSEWPGPPDHKS